MLDSSHLSSQVWAAQLDRAECCHKSCSFVLDQTSLWRGAEIRYQSLFRSALPNQRSYECPAMLGVFSDRHKQHPYSLQHRTYLLWQ